MEARWYYPIEMIFNLLSVLRWTGAYNLQSIRKELARRGLRSYPAAGSPSQISFWLRLCRAGSLLDEEDRPTLLVEDWLGWPFYNQMQHLISAWQEAPVAEKSRRNRRELITRLYDLVNRTASQAILSPLKPVHLRELPGLQTLGIWDRDILTPPGAALLNRAGEKNFLEISPERWILADDVLLIPFPPAWKLLWELEAYLRPEGAGRYPMDPPAIRRAAQVGAGDHQQMFVKVLELGLGDKPPDWLIQGLAAEPAIRILPGPVLEFSDPEELKSLRKSKNLRKELNHLLSPRHAALNPWRAHRVLRGLRRRGLVSDRDLDHGSQESGWILGNHESTKSEKQYLSRAERVYLLSLLLAAEGLQNSSAAPVGLLAKLTQNMDHSLRAAAARKATEILRQVWGDPVWDENSLQDEEEESIEPTEEVLRAIQGAIDRSESIQIIYKASSRHSPEARHLSPLLLEPRGGRYYLVAYCHMRRANRTFRLDRLKLVDFPIT